MKVLVVVCVSLFVLTVRSIEVKERIVGGTAVRTHKYPYIVSLRDATNRHICSGSLVHEKWVLTIARCSLKKPTMVVGGIINLDDTTGTTSTVDSIYTEDEEVAAIDRFGIAMIKLLTPFTYSSNIAPITLDDKHSDAIRDCVIVGWDKEKQLKAVEETTISDHDCSNDPLWIDLLGPLMSNVGLCTVAKKQGEGVCEEDFGGPLVMRRDGKDVLLGVVSMAPKCGEKGPVVNMRVSSYFGWIRSFYEEITHDYFKF